MPRELSTRCIGRERRKARSRAGGKGVIHRYQPRTPLSQCQATNLGNYGARSVYVAAGRWAVLIPRRVTPLTATRSRGRVRVHATTRTQPRENPIDHCTVPRVHPVHGIAEARYTRRRLRPLLPSPIYRIDAQLSNDVGRRRARKKRISTLISRRATRPPDGKYIRYPTTYHQQTRT